MKKCIICGKILTDKALGLDKILNIKELKKLKKLRKKQGRCAECSMQLLMLNIIGK